MRQSHLLKEQAQYRCGMSILNNKGGYLGHGQHLAADLDGRKDAIWIARPFDLVFQE